MERYMEIIKMAEVSQLTAYSSILNDALPKDLSNWTAERLRETLRGVGFGHDSLSGAAQGELVDAIEDCRKLLKKELSKSKSKNGTYSKGGHFVRASAPRKVPLDYDEFVVERRSSRRAPAKKVAAARKKRVVESYDVSESESESYEVEEVLSHRVDEDENIEYLVKFKGYDEPEYVDEEGMSGSKNLLKEYHDSLLKETAGNAKGTKRKAAPKATPQSKRARTKSSTPAKKSPARARAARGTTTPVRTSGRKITPSKKAAAAPEKDGATTRSRATRAGPEVKTPSPRGRAATRTSTKKETPKKESPRRGKKASPATKSKGKKATPAKKVTPAKKATLAKKASPVRKTRASATKKATPAKKASPSRKPRAATKTATKKVTTGKRKATASPATSTRPKRARAASTTTAKGRGTRRGGKK